MCSRARWWTPWQPRNTKPPDTAITSMEIYHLKGLWSYKSPTSNETRQRYCTKRQSWKKCFHQLTASPVCRWRENWKIAAIELSISTTPQSRIPFRRHWWIIMLFKHSCAFLISHWRWNLVELLAKDNMRCREVWMPQRNHSQVQD